MPSAVRGDLPRRIVRSETDSTTSSSENESLLSSSSSSSSSSGSRGRGTSAGLSSLGDASQFQPLSESGPSKIDVGEDSSSNDNEDDYDDDESEENALGVNSPSTRIRTPRAMLRARSTLLGALGYALSICATIRQEDFESTSSGQRSTPDRSGRGAKGVDKPWTGLLRILPDLRKVSGDPKLMAYQGFGPCLGVLSWLITTQILPLGRDRGQAREKLAKSEARALASFSKSWESTGVTIQSLRRCNNDYHSVLNSTPCILIYRLCLCATSIPCALDLSALSSAVSKQLETLDIPDLFEMFEITPDDIRSLNLSNNNLTSIPPWSTVFTSLRKLDVSCNPISSLPMGLTRLRINRIRISRTDLVDPVWLDGDFSRTPRVVARTRLTARQRGTESLVMITIASLLKSGVNLATLEGCPPHLARLLHRSYCCELCDSPVLWNTKEYLERPLKVTWMAQPARIKRTRGGHGASSWARQITIPQKKVVVSGRVCRRCSVNIWADRCLATNGNVTIT